MRTREMSFYLLLLAKGHVLMDAPLVVVSRGSSQSWAESMPQDHTPSPPPPVLYQGLRQRRRRRRERRGWEEEATLRQAAVVRPQAGGVEIRSGRWVVV